MNCMILSVFVVVENVKDTNAKLTFTMVATALLFDAFLTLFFHLPAGGGAFYKEI